MLLALTLLSTPVPAPGVQPAAAPRSIAGALLRAPVALLACLYAVAIGATERLSRDPIQGGSDVLPATGEAIYVLLAGRNPYTHVMQSTTPIGSPFVYPPGEMFFYLPAYLAGLELHRVETWTGIFTIAAIALAGARAGWGQAALPAMLYATWGIAAFRTTDGGNDVSAAFLAVVAFVALAFPGRFAFFLSAFALGWAVAFKQFAVLVLPLVLRHLAIVDAGRARSSGADGAGGRGWRMPKGSAAAYALVSLGTATAMTLPFFLMDPVAFAGQQLQALTFHQEVWGANLLHALAFAGADVDGLLGVFFALELVVTLAALALAVRSRLDTLGRTLVVACLLVSLPLMLARWTTQSYYVYAATLALAGLAVTGVTAAGYQRGGRSHDHVGGVRRDTSSPGSTTA